MLFCNTALNTEHFTNHSLTFWAKCSICTPYIKIGFLPMNKLHNDLHVPHLSSLLAAMVIMAALWGPLAVMAAKVAGY